MTNTVVVCNGCCCGRVEKGHSEVPVDLLKDSWLGKLSENEHFEALIEWALSVSSDGDSAELPELLEVHRFVRDESNS